MFSVANPLRLTYNKSIMKLLVIGGTYFLGKAFVKELLAGYDAVRGELSVTLFNRGTRPLPAEVVDYAESRGIRLEQVRGDRRSAEDIASISDESFDVIVDFCAYAKGDIRCVTDNLKSKFYQYIFVVI